ncbi:hypothetical protein BDZ94DRAFT_1240501 [Collybia nuda]|uniref:Uncharacterized protein n=1 Tax=Collybia nuda TaxID=64659 RepID=A0A9P5XY12_9AGAR|nr:hypothetical protein BDZ94DRAFT_1240501 [Collybia nuda]
MLFMFYHNARVLSPSVREPKNLTKQRIERTDPEWFPKSFSALANRFQNFLANLTKNESVEIKNLINHLEEDLRYQADSLEAHKSRSDFNKFSAVDPLNKLADHFHESKIRQYVHKHTKEMMGDLDRIISVLGALRKNVTATTLQMSEGLEQTWLVSIINTFWLCSLALSIGAALNSLLALVWMQAPYGTRGRGLPWIHMSAPVFLALSIGCFLAGLVFFSYASQKRYTFILTLVSTAMTTSGLLTVSSWIVYEQWVAPFIWGHPGGRGGADFPDEISEESSTSPTTPLDILHALHHPQGPVTSFLRALMSYNGRNTRNEQTFLDCEGQSSRNETMDVGRPRNPLRHLAKITALVNRIPRMPWEGIPHAAPRMGSPTLVTMNGSSSLVPFANHLAPNQSSTRKSRSILFHYGTVQDLVYSPDNSKLAVTSWNSTTVILSSENYKCTHKYRHIYRKSKQITWSPDGNNLLVRLLDNIVDLLDSVRPFLDCVFPGGAVLILSRKRNVPSSRQSSDRTFLTCEKNDIFELNLDGRIFYSWWEGSLSHKGSTYQETVELKINS